MRLATFISGIFIGAVLFTGFSVVLAWTGPSSAPPNGNMSAPLNVGTTDQVKNSGLGINSLAVFGNAILSGTSRYLNFGTTAGSSGYGIRDNAGILEFKNTDGSWSSVTSTVFSEIQSYFVGGSSNIVNQIKFADGTTQTTAAAGVTAATVVSCSNSYGCTATCPQGYLRSGCSSKPAVATEPSGSSGCTCGSNWPYAASCYAYCVK